MTKPTLQFYSSPCNHNLWSITMTLTKSFTHHFASSKISLSSHLASWNQAWWNQERYPYTLVVDLHYLNDQVKLQNKTNCMVKMCFLTFQNVFPNSKSSIPELITVLLIFTHDVNQHAEFQSFWSNQAWRNQERCPYILVLDLHYLNDQVKLRNKTN